MHDAAAASGHLRDLRQRVPGLEILAAVIYGDICLLARGRQGRPWLIAASDHTRFEQMLARRRACPGPVMRRALTVTRLVLLAGCGAQDGPAGPGHAAHPVLSAAQRCEDEVIGLLACTA